MLASLLPALLALGPSAPTNGSTCPGSIDELRYEADAECVDLAPIRTDDWLLSVGGEVRQRVTFVESFEFGASQTEGDGSNTQRYLLHLDARLRGVVQVFLQLGSQVAVDLDGPPNPLERNDFDLRQAFLRGDFSRVRPWAGRRALSFGSERLVSRREGPNVRRVFDGLGVELYPGDLRLDVFLARPVDVEPAGVFNDFRWLDGWLWGAHLAGPLAWSGFDAYYVGFHEADASFVAGVADETRHSFGVRWFGDLAGWDWNTEAIVQLGAFGDQTIWAWTVASIAGYAFRSLPWSPRLALSANIASGDADPDDDTLQSFNALYPRGNYFSEAAVLGPQNFFNVHGYLTVNPLPQLSATVDVNAYWRASVGDGVYGPPGSLIRGPGGSRERFVAWAVSSALEWRIDRNFDATAIYTQVVPGPFIEATGPAPVTHFAEFTVRARF